MRVVLAVVAFALVAAVLVVALTAESFLRGWAESEINDRLVGYTVKIGGLDLRILALGFDLVDTSFTQDAHPDPAVAHLQRFGVSLSWSALLRGNLLSELEIESPALYLERANIVRETEDGEGLADKGWREALFAVYPMEVDHVRVRDGSVTYLGDEGDAPIELTSVRLEAQNIRNVRGQSRYPSPVSLQATLFDSGHIEVEGAADFLAVPHVALDASFALDTVPLRRFDPLASEVDVHVDGGVLGADGSLEFSREKRSVYVRRLRVDGVEVTYTAGSGSAAEERRQRWAEDAAEQLQSDSTTKVYLDRLEVRGSRLTYHRVDRDYRLFSTQTSLTAKDVANRDSDKPASFEAEGRFMDAGDLAISGSYRATNASPDFDIDVNISETPLVELNDLLTAYAGFDAASGMFAFYSELAAKEGRLEGYVKPILSDVDIYDRTQDKRRSVCGEVYEGAVDVLSQILENSADDVAAKVSVAGRIDDPEVSTWDAIVSLVSNAFVKSVSPGVDP